LTSRTTWYAKAPKMRFKSVYSILQHNCPFLLFTSVVSTSVMYMTIDVIPWTEVGPLPVQHRHTNTAANKAQSLIQIPWSHCSGNFRPRILRAATDGLLQLY
jgi:hypothetical protein